MNDGQDRHQRILIPADLSEDDPETESNALRLIRGATILSASGADTS